MAEVAEPEGQNLDLNRVLLTPGLALLGPRMSLPQRVRGRREGSWVGCSTRPTARAVASCLLKG